MSGLRFRAGEPAVLVVAIGPKNERVLGEVVTVVRLLPRAGEFINGGEVMRDCDYALIGPEGERTLAMDHQLRKLDPPSEPASLTRQQSEELPA